MNGVSFTQLNLLVMVFLDADPDFECWLVADVLEDHTASIIRADLTQW
jgi:hypothetical protein